MGKGYRNQWGKYEVVGCLLLALFLLFLGIHGQAEAQVPHIAAVSCFQPMKFSLPMVISRR